MSLRQNSLHPAARAGLQVMAFGVAAAFVALFAFEPHLVGANASEAYAPTVTAAAGQAQSLEVAAGSATTITRDGYTVILPPPPPPAPVPVAVPVSAAAAAGGSCFANVVPTPGLPDPGSVQDIAFQALPSYGWDEKQYYYLLALWKKESGWNPAAHNASSGAHGIPQALPGDKMGPGWESDPHVQIGWGLGYIAGRYGSPCEAWASSVDRGWY
ncbi:MAG: lytic transglycosylase domain-containing protein [Herbiconiux sp.]|nr:lytic transglycosylase domain-containing protein [Herbiconiux sp.]